MKTYTVVNDEDANDSFEVTAEDYEKALTEALAQLGWWITAGAEIDGPVVD
jgi:hypothetical protein